MLEIEKQRGFHLLFAVHLMGKWLVCYDDGKVWVKVGGPYETLQGPGSAFEGMAMLRSQRAADGIVMR